MEQKSGKWQWRHNLSTECHCRIFADVVVFLLTILHSGQSFTSISLLYLKLWQFLIIRVLNGIPEIAKKPCLNLPNIWGLRRVKDTKFGMNVSIGSYLILQSWKLTVFTVFQLFGKKQQGRAGKTSPTTTTQIRIKEHYIAMQWLLYQSLSTGFTMKAVHCKI